MKFSLMFFSSGEGASAAASYDAIREMARFADREGLARVWLPERHFVRFGALHPNPAVLAAAVACDTTRVRIAAGSVVAPLHDAIRISEEWSIVDNLSRGRVDAAFAAGWRAGDFALATDGYASRYDTLRERVADVRTLWRGGAIRRRIEGIAESTSVTTYPRPVQPELPLWITAARAMDTFVLAGELGANVLTYAVDVGIDGLADRIAAYRKARRRAGFAGDGLVTVMLHTHLGGDSSAVRAVAEPAYRRYIVENRSLVGHGEAISERDATQVAEAQFARMFENLSLVGAVEKCVPLVNTLRTIGVDEIACLVDFIDNLDVVTAGLPFITDLSRRFETPPAASTASSEPALEQRPLINIEAPAFYGYIESIGGRYGPSFQLVERASADQDAALTVIRAPDIRHAAHARMLLTDAVISTAHAIGMTPPIRGSSRVLGLPIGIGRADICDVTADRYSVRTRRTGDSSDAVEFDVEALTPDGRIALRLSKVRFQRLPVGASDPRDIAARALVHDLDWTELPDDRDRGSSMDTSIAVAASEPADASMIGAVLRACGMTVIDQRAAPIIGAGVSQLLFAHSIEEWRIGDLLGPRAVVERVVSWFNNASPDAMLVVLVRGAFRIGANDPPPDPIAAAAWAAAASLASERRQRVTLVDVDPNESLHDGVLTFARLREQVDARLAAIRGGKAYGQAFSVRADDVPASSSHFSIAGTSALITGGTGAIGRLLAGWLVEEGARAVHLISRHASRDGGFANALRSRAVVETIDADVATAHGAARATGGVDTLFHLAGDVVNAAGASADREVIDRCFRPKLDGIVRLHDAFASAPPRRVVVFSSIAALTGSAGQCAYAAANAAMAAAVQRLPAFRAADTRILWFGPWSGSGMSAGADIEALVRAKGLEPIAPWDALRAMNAMLARPARSAVIGKRLVSARPHSGDAAAIKDFSAMPSAIALLERLRATTTEARPAIVEAEIIRHVAAIMERESASLDANHSLYDFGFDSLMAIELKNTVTMEYGIEIGLVDLMKATTIADVARVVLPMLEALPTAATPADSGRDADGRASELVL